MSRWRDVVHTLHLMCLRDPMVGVMLGIGIGSVAGIPLLVIAAIRDLGQ